MLAVRRDCLRGERVYTPRGFWALNYSASRGGRAVALSPLREGRTVCIVLLPRRVCFLVSLLGVRYFVLHCQG